MRTKTLLTLSMMLVMVSALKAQILTPVKWSYAAKRTAKNETVVFIKATIDDGWHIYCPNCEGRWAGENQFYILRRQHPTRLLGVPEEPTPIIRERESVQHGRKLL